MTHCQMFKAFDNEDGYVSVIVHRERFVADMRKMGFVDTIEEVTKPKPVKRAKSNDASDSSDK